MYLVINCGSQSIKWKLFDSDLKKIKEGKRSVSSARFYQDILFKELKDLKDHKKDIEKIAHRFVHGGSKFRKPVKITEDNLRDLVYLKKLAPLHNPFNLLGIKIAKRIFDVPQYAVFDTEFYNDLPPKAYEYALPEKFNFRKYGFHGISHEYVAREGAKKIKKPFSGLKIITCHLGGGSSITAIKNGKAIDTSMGFTPMGGTMMMTRSGDLDPGVVLGLVKKTSWRKANNILNHQSGFKALTGKGNMLDVLDGVKKNKKKEALALDIYAYQIQKYIGSYYAVLGGCDLLIFTGAIGSGDPKTRNTIVKGLKILKNTKVLAIKTNEGLAIAQKIK